jgi:hypothetical protein
LTFLVFQEKKSQNSIKDAGDDGRNSPINGKVKMLESQNNHLRVLLDDEAIKVERGCKNTARRAAKASPT